MSRTPLRVSIGIPAYKASRWIRVCLDGLLAQTMPDFEIIISDNGSPDDTVAICEDQARRDPRIRVFRQGRNIGARANHQFVIDQARAPYFLWVSANDWYAPDYLARCLAVLDSQPDVLVVNARASTFRDVPGDGRALAEPPLADEPDVRCRLYGVMSSMKHSRLFRGVVRRDAVAAFGPLHPAFGHDHRLLVWLATQGRLVQLHEPLYFERIAAGAATHLIPMHERARHYEPELGYKAILFHRIRILGYYWVLALRNARRHGGLAWVLPRMLRVCWDQRSMVWNDCVEALRLLRGISGRRSVMA